MNINESMRNILNKLNESDRKRDNNGLVRDIPNGVMIMWAELVDEWAEKNGIDYDMSNDNDGIQDLADKMYDHEVHTYDEAKEYIENQAEQKLEMEYDEDEDDDLYENDIDETFVQGQRVKLSGPYASHGEPDETFILMTWDGSSGFIVDDNNQGWNIRGYQIEGVEDEQMIDEDGNPAEDGSINLVIHALERAGYEATAREDYSGKFMYGAITSGVVTNATFEEMEEAFNSYQESSGDYDTIMPQRSDSMGLQYIHYY